MKYKHAKKQTEIPDAVYESMLRVFIKLALKKQKHDRNLSRPRKKQGVF